MSVDLNQTLDLHKQILNDLEMREAAAATKEADVRRELEKALQDITAEKCAIDQHRELLTQTEMLYRAFAGTDDTDPIGGAPRE